MKNRFFKRLVSFAAVCLLLLSTLSVSAKGKDSAQDIFNGIISYKLQNAEVSTVQQWIDGDIASNAGITSEWYVLALSQYGEYDFDNYGSTLLKYIKENEVYSASSRQKYALALIAMGSTDQYIYTTLNDSIGKQGVMSFVYGLHLLNNGYKSNAYTLAEVKSKLLSLQLSDGGWAIMGTVGDADVTAMAVQALSPYYNTDLKVKAAIDNALSLLSSLQQPNGDYLSYGVGNPESTAQVLVALCSLGIDCTADSRFKKNGNTLLDGIEKYKLTNGGFCHKIGGEYNENATSQVFYSMVSYLRFKGGEGGFYILDARNPDGLKVPESTSPSQAADSSYATASKITSSKKSSVASHTKADSSKTASVASVNDTTINKKNTVSKEVASNKSSSTNTISKPTESYKAVQSAASSVTTPKESELQSPTISAAATAPINNKGGSIGYKPIAAAVIIAVAIGLGALLFFIKKRNKSNFIAIIIGTVLLLALVFLTNFESKDSYYNGANLKKVNPVGTVTLTIRCDTAITESGNKLAPVILDDTVYDIESGDTAYDILKEACAKNKIHLETNGNSENIYVEGINNLYEFQYGDLSGWVYRVNGEELSVSCGEYVLKNGDKIEWLYTLSLGKDLQ